MYMKIHQFNQKEYINSYNKENYKMYQFRVKKNSKTIKYLDKIPNRNNYLVNLIEKDLSSNKVLTLSQIKRIIKPILNSYGIKNINLFGSYARGDANNNSDIDIYCDTGNIHTLLDQSKMTDELKKALKKEVDIVFVTSKMDPYFKKTILEDMIKLC